jgi:hypothetical protein
MAKYAFKLKSGSHVYRDENGTDVVLEPGDTKHTDLDMRKLEGRDRWDLIDDQGPESIEELKARIRILEGFAKPQEEPQAEVAEDDGLDGKSIKQLREMAADMTPPVDLSGISSKDAIIAAIRSAADNA